MPNARMGNNRISMDDPYAESRPVYEGEFHVVEPRKAMSTYVQEIQELKQAAQHEYTVRNKGPQPRTRFPRRR